jgi:hypothetical protein
VETECAQEVIRTDGRTDITMLLVAFRKFVNATKIAVQIFLHGPTSVIQDVQIYLKLLCICELLEVNAKKITLLRLAFHQRFTESRCRDGDFHASYSVGPGVENTAWRMALLPDFSQIFQKSRAIVSNISKFVFLHLHVEYSSKLIFSLFRNY